MEAKSKKKKFEWKRLLIMAFFMLIGMACGVFMAMYMKASGFEEKGIGQQALIIILLFVQMYVSIYVQTIIHEAGHLVFGLASGYQFTSFRIGSLMWVKDGEELRLKRFRVAGTGGQCLMAPPDLVEGKIPVILYNLGGSILNVIASVVFLVVYFVSNNNSIISTWCLMLIVIGVMFALMNGIPLRLGAVDNDGYNAYSLGKNKEALRAFWIQMKANELISKGKRLKDMPEEWFELPSDENMKNSIIATIAVFACNRLIDEHRFEEADALMWKLLNNKTGIIGVHKGLLICDCMYCELIGENRKEKLDEMRTKEQKDFMKSMKTFLTVLRVEYVYALLGEQDKTKANLIKNQFEKHARVYPYACDVESERELIQIAEAKFKERTENVVVENQE